MYIIIILGIYTRCQQMKVKVGVGNSSAVKVYIHYKTQTSTCFAYIYIYIYKQMNYESSPTSSRRPPQSHPSLPLVSEILRQIQDPPFCFLKKKKPAEIFLSLLRPHPCRKPAEIFFHLLCCFTSGVPEFSPTWFAVLLPTVA